MSATNNLSTTISKFEIVGSYVVHLYFNEFYMQSKKLFANKAYPSIMDGYKNILCDYSKFIKSDRFFKNIISGINMNCKTVTVYTNMNEAECVNFMVKEFIPENVYGEIKYDNKKAILTIVLSNCLQKFSHELLINHIDSIVDKRNNENVVKLQDLFLNIIKLEKDKMYSKFINPSPNNVPVDLFTNIQKKLIDLSKTKRDLIQRNTGLMKENTELTDKMKQLLEFNLINNKKIKELEQENNKLLKNISLLNGALTENSKKIETMNAQIQQMNYDNYKDESGESDESDVDEKTDSNDDKKFDKFEFITTTNNPKMKDITDSLLGEDTNTEFKQNLNYVEEQEDGDE